MTAEIVADIY